MGDNVNHPSHYTQLGVECIDVIEWLPLNRGNAIKYIWRAGLKGDEIEDLRKAVWYIDREIDRIKNADTGFKITMTFADDNMAYVRQQKTYDMFSLAGHFAHNRGNAMYLLEMSGMSMDDSGLMMLGSAKGYLEREIDSLGTGGNVQC